MTADLRSATCVNHASREAIGVCVQCRTRICSECVTKIDGINYCVKCLTGLEDKQSAVPFSNPSVQSRSLPWFTMSLYVLVLWALSWVALSAALPGLIFVTVY